jgi:hypothetical protein
LSRRRGLSKSKIISGLQCPKRLYLEITQPELADDSGAQMAFSIGNAFGALAQTLYPHGQLIEHDDELDKALTATQLAMEDDSIQSVFEATFVHDNVLIRADVLTKTDNGVILTEVKASTSVKNYHITDAAVQTWVLENCGYHVERINIGHVNREFVYPGGEDYQGILVEADITDAVRERIANVRESVDALREMLSGDVPDIEVGPQCNSPFSCPFQNHCLPEQSDYPVSNLPGKGRIVQELLDEGIEDIRDIPEGRLTNATQEKVRRLTAAGEEEIAPAAAEAVNALGFPRYYLDFETSGMVIPIWTGLRPYEMVPFQWSCHVEHADGRLEHFEFLDTSGAPPMRKLAQSLIDSLGLEGPILMYTSFERGVIEGLRQRYPDLKDDLGNLLDRLVDLYPIVKQHYYHPDMLGSWSIKAVLPAMVPHLSYKDLEGIANGMAAANAYLEIIDLETPDERKQALRNELLEYCKLDTLAMVEVAKRLSGSYS